MLQPIQKEHEVVCPGCGCVLGEVHEPQVQIETTIKPSVDMMLLGSALESNVKISQWRTPQQVYEEKVLRFLVYFTKKYSLPEAFAIQTFNELKRKKKGFRSENYNIPIKQLIQILSKDDNYIYIKTLRAIKAKYESIIAD